MKALALTFICSAFVLGAQNSAPKIPALIIDGQNNHDWQHTTPLLKTILEATGLFRVDVLTTPPKRADFSRFRPQFENYRAVIANYNDFGGGTVWPPEVQAAFEQYLRSGGGFVSYHAADNAFPNWPAYNLMIGIGGWEGRDEKSGPFWYFRDGKLVSNPTPGQAGNHGARKPFQVTMRDRTHPIAKGLPEVWMHASDELYSRMRGPGEKHDGARYGIFGSAESRHGPRRADAHGAERWQRPRIPHYTGSRSGSHPVRRVCYDVRAGSGVGRDR